MPPPVVLGPLADEPRDGIIKGGSMIDKSDTRIKTTIPSEREKKPAKEPKRQQTEARRLYRDDTWQEGYTPGGKPEQPKKKGRVTTKEWIE